MTSPVDSPMTLCFVESPLPRGGQFARGTEHEQCLEVTEKRTSMVKKSTFSSSSIGFRIFAEEKIIKSVRIPIRRFYPSTIESVGCRRSSSVHLSPFIFTSLRILLRDASFILIFVQESGLIGLKKVFLSFVETDEDVHQSHLANRSLPSRSLRTSVWHDERRETFHRGESLWTHSQYDSFSSIELKRSRRYSAEDLQ